MQKSLIKQRFKKSLKSYEDNALVQKRMAKKLCEMIDLKNYKNILELGCGTGFLTSEIINKFGVQNYDALDIVKECGEYVNKINPDINFICEEIENFAPDNKKYDLIISNASLQWLEDLNGYTDKLKTMLKEGGEFVFTLFGKNNFKEMSEYIKTPLKYYGEDEIKNIFKDFEIKECFEEDVVLLFDTPIDVLRHIKLTGVNALSETRWTKSDLINFETTYPKMKNGRYSLTYQPIYIKIYPIKRR